MFYVVFVYKIHRVDKMQHYHFSRPFFSRPSGNRPNGNRPNGNRPSGNEPMICTCNYKIIFDTTTEIVKC